MSTPIPIPSGATVRLVPPRPPMVVAPAPAPTAVFVVPAKGPRGATGPPGDGGFTHTQVTPAATWTITNTLGRYPAAVMVVVDNVEVTTDVEFPDLSTITVTFANPQSGRAEIL